MEVMRISEQQLDFISLEEAAKWASEYLKKDVSKNNISYLVNYGKILKYDSCGNWNTVASNGGSRIKIEELKNYYDKFLFSLYLLIQNYLFRLSSHTQIVTW